MMTYAAIQLSFLNIPACLLLNEEYNREINEAIIICHIHLDLTPVINYTTLTLLRLMYFASNL